MKYKCEVCGALHEGLQDSCPVCGVKFESILDKVSQDKEGFKQLKSKIIESLSYEFMFGEDEDRLTLSFPFESMTQLARDYKKFLNRLSNFVDKDDVEFLDRCFYSLEWVLGYAVMFFSYSGKDVLGKGSVLERIKKASGFSDEES